jgi:hypothetical protein
MARAFIFSLTVILLFSVLLILFYTLQIANSPSVQLTEVASAKRLAYAWTDVDQQVPALTQLGIVQTQNLVTFYDQLPSPFNVTNSLAGYQAFVSDYYSFNGVNASFANGFAALAPVWQVNPLGINYSYPSWNKTQANITCVAGGSGCNWVKSIGLVLQMANYTFPCNPANASACGSNFSWSPAPPNCAVGSAHCVNFTLAIYDELNRSFTCPNNNASQADCPYYSFNWTSATQPVLTFSTNQTSSCKFKLVLGGGGLAAFSLLSSNSSCGTLFANTTLALNTTGFWVNEQGYLTVRNQASNQSITRQVSS